MVGSLLLLDTNVLIYALNRNRLAAVEIVARAAPRELAISIMTWMEVLVGSKTEIASEMRMFLESFTVIGLDRYIAEESILVRKATKLKLPDAIIYATALVSNRTLVTYNTRDFPPGTPSVHTPSS